MDEVQASIAGSRHEDLAVRSMGGLTLGYAPAC